MQKRLAHFVTAICLCLLFPAQLPAEDRAAVETRIRAEISSDLAAPLQPEALSGRSCLDGRPAAEFPGEIAEYWVNLECPWCGIQEPLQAQRQNADLCVIVRHIPSREYGESLKKALSYEALKKFSVNAANIFWDTVVPKKPRELPKPYEASLLLAFQEAAIDPEAFGEALGKEAALLINVDLVAAKGRISVTPTWVLAGLRFSACDFTAEQLPLALALAKKARAGDTEALEQVIAMIIRAFMNEPVL
jgi:hypothetical protein